MDEANAHVSFAVELEEMLALLGQETVIVDGVDVAVMATVPEKPPRLVKVRVELAFDPDWNARADGLPTNEKSTTLMSSWTECDTPPLVAVTVIV